MQLQTTTTPTGRKFQVSSLPAVLSFRLWAKIIKQHGAAISKLFGAWGQDESKQAEAVGDLLLSLDVDLLEELRSTFVQVSLVDDKPVNNDATYNAAFSGKIGDQMLWLKFCLTSEFGHFFQALAASGGLELAAGLTTQNT